MILMYAKKVISRRYYKSSVSKYRCGNIKIAKKEKPTDIKGRQRRGYPPFCKRIPELHSISIFYFLFTPSTHVDIANCHLVRIECQMVAK
jgi:hypothetical protein